jgi:hypothetical protein
LYVELISLEMNGELLMQTLLISNHAGQIPDIFFEENAMVKLGTRLAYRSIFALMANRKAFGSRVMHPCGTVNGPRA